MSKTAPFKNAIDYFCEQMEQIILIATFIIPLILSVVIIYNAQGNKSKKILAFSMINASAVFIANYFYFIEDFSVYSYMHSLHVALVLLIYPSLYLYLKTLTENYSFKPKILVHFIPPIVFFVLYFVLFDLRFEHSERVSFLSNYRDDLFETGNEFITVEWLRILNVVAIISQVIGYSAAIFIISHQYHQKIKNEFSNADNYQIKWLVWFNLALIAIAILSVLFYVINPFDDSHNYLLMFSMFSMSIFIWLIGIWGNAQASIEFPSAQPYQNTDNNELESIFNNLVMYMNEKKPFLKPDLSLSELAIAMASNRTYISQAINCFAQMNYNTFINKFRIEEAQKIIEQNPQVKIENLASQAGFGSSVSMQRAFTKQTGFAPKEWKNKKVAS